MVLEVVVACYTYLWLQHHTFILHFKEIASPTADVESMTVPLVDQSQI